MKGRLVGTNIIVDNFRDVPKDGLQCVWFLTHAHADHLVGLSDSFDAGPIYSSPATGALLARKFGLRPGIVHCLDLDKQHTVPLDDAGAVTCAVTLIDANHCPGAVMLLFEGAWFGTVLHTGDFRFHPRMLQHEAIVRVCGRRPKVPSEVTRLLSVAYPAGRSSASLETSITTTASSSASTSLERVIGGDGDFVNESAGYQSDDDVAADYESTTRMTPVDHNNAYALPSWVAPPQAVGSAAPGLQNEPSIEVDGDALASSENDNATDWFGDLFDDDAADGVGERGSDAAAISSTTPAPGIDRI